MSIKPNGFAKLLPDMTNGMLHLSLLFSLPLSLFYCFSAAFSFFQISPKDSLYKCALVEYNEHMNKRL